MKIIAPEGKVLSQSDVEVRKSIDDSQTEFLENTLSANLFKEEQEAHRR